MGTTTRFGQIQADAFLGAANDNSPFGKIWYVDGTNGANGNAGDSPSEAYADLNTAITASVATRGDTIVVYPGTYTITTVLNPKANTTFRAAVVCPQYPTVTLSSNIASLMTLNVSGVRFIGFRFLASGTTITELVTLASTANVNGDLFEDCMFEGRLHNTQHIAGISADSATYFPTGLVVRRCLFKNLGLSQLEIGIKGAPWAKIEDNVFHISTPLGYGIAMANTGGSNVGVGYVIRNNDFIGTKNNVGIYIAGSEEDTQWGMIRSNFFAHCVAAAITANTNTKGIINNYYGDTSVGGVLVDVGD